MFVVLGGRRVRAYDAFVSQRICKLKWHAVGRALSMIAAVGLLAAPACERQSSQPAGEGATQGVPSATRKIPPTSADTDAVASSDVPWFTDVAQEVGLHFMHDTGATGAFYFPEVAASGCAFFDYDNDGDLDVYAVQAKPIDPAYEPEPGRVRDGRNRLFRNELVPLGALRFVDVTDAAGVEDDGYGLGCAVGDYDNDGDWDLYVTNFGADALYRNNGDHTFANVTGTAIEPNDRWASSATFFDYDRDGLLDLFVVNYVDFVAAENPQCHSRSSRRDYCGPSAFQPMPDRLYRNTGSAGDNGVVGAAEGNGPTFVEDTLDAGIDRAFGSGLGVVAADFDGDDWPDLYVANDGNANQLWINQRDGTFVNTALPAGAAYNAQGMAEAGMGVSAGDFDLDGDEDIFLAHLTGEHNTLLVNDGGGYFEDRTEAAGLGTPGWGYTGFGAEWFDFDHDGYLDMFVANGAVKIAEEYADREYPYPNPNLLLRNTGPPAFAFEDVSDRAGPDVTALHVSRGAAFGDIDNDGDIDILVTNSNGPLQLLRNNVGSRRSWLMLQLRGGEKNRCAFGAKVTLARADGPPLVRRVHSDGSYCSANDPRVHFGLGNADKPQAVMVQWPDGQRERFDNVPVRTISTLVQGNGAAP